MKADCPRYAEEPSACDVCALIGSAINAFRAEMMTVPDVLCMRCGVPGFSARNR